MQAENYPQWNAICTSQDKFKINTSNADQYKTSCFKN